MAMWYNRKGTPISTRRASYLLGRPKYKILKQTKTKNLKYWVSTVWLGLDHNFNLRSKPLIFETMVFPHNVIGGVLNYGDLDMDRYSTEKEALRGHNRMVKKWENL